MGSRTHSTSRSFEGSRDSNDSEVDLDLTKNTLLKRREGHLSKKAKPLVDEAAVKLPYVKRCAITYTPESCNIQYAHLLPRAAEGDLVSSHVLGCSPLACIWTHSWTDWNSPRV